MVFIFDDVKNLEESVNCLNKPMLVFTPIYDYCSIWSNAEKELASFGFKLFLDLIGFIYLFYLLFISQMLFELSLLKFNAREFIQAAPILSPLAFSLFILLVIFTCRNIFARTCSSFFRVY